MMQKETVFVYTDSTAKLKSRVHGQNPGLLNVEAGDAKSNIAL
jgi:hypothetical protein